MAQTKRLGEILIEAGLINEGQLEKALHRYLRKPFEPDDLLSRIEFIRSRYYRESSDLPESS